MQKMSERRSLGQIQHNEIWVWTKLGGFSSVSDVLPKDFKVDTTWVPLTELGDASSAVHFSVTSLPDNQRSLIRCDWYFGAWDLIVCEDAGDLLDFLAKYGYLANLKHPATQSDNKPQSNLEQICGMMLTNPDGFGRLMSGYRAAVRARYKASDSLEEVVVPRPASKWKRFFTWIANFGV